MGLGLVGGEPDRTAPDTFGSERHGRGHLPTATDATRAEHRDRCVRVDDLRDEDHRTDLPGVAARFVALGDDDVDACLHVSFGVYCFAGQCADQAPFRLDPVDQELRRRTERVCDEGGPVRECDIELGTGCGCREGGGIGTPLAETPFVSGVPVDDTFGNLIAAEDVVDEGLELSGNEASDVVDAVAALLVPGVPGGDDEIDSVVSVADLVLDPVEVDLQLLWAVGHRSEHSEPSGLRDSCDHVAAVGEREDRELDVEQFGDGRVHGPTLRVQAAPGCRLSCRDPVPVGLKNLDSGHAAVLYSLISPPRTSFRVTRTSIPMWDGGPVAGDLLNAYVAGYLGLSRSSRRNAVCSSVQRGSLV